MNVCVCTYTDVCVACWRAYIYIYVYMYTGQWSRVWPEWCSLAPTASNSRLETHGSPDHRQPCPWVGDPVWVGACLQSGNDSSPTNSATPAAKDGNLVRHPRSERSKEVMCSSPLHLTAHEHFFSQHVHFTKGCLPDCGCCPTARLRRPGLAAVCAKLGLLGSSCGRSP